MANESMKTLRAKAEEAVAAGVANRQQLLAALPQLVALQNAVKAAELRLKETKAVLADLNGLCSDYAHAHPEYVFGDSFSVSPVGVESGDLTADGTAYHFSYGFDGYRPTDPTLKLTQDLLGRLPDGWTRQRLELNATGIRNAGATAEELAEAGLERKPKPVWCAM